MDKNLVKEIAILFVIVILSNILSEIGEEEKTYLIRPGRVFGSAFVLSIIGGFVTHKIKASIKNNHP